MKMKDTMVLIVILCASVSMFSGCNDQNGERMSKNETSKAVYSKINAAQGKAMMDDGNLYTLIDVRTEQEYKAQHIKGAVLIPHTEMLNRAETGLPDKNARIIIYCRSGGRSATAAHTLVDLGYTHVYDMGGIMDWPYDTVRQ